MDLKLVKNQKIKDFVSGNFILNGDCKDVLNNLPKESINCVITSPPYFNQRNYGGSEHVEILLTPPVATPSTIQFSMFWKWRVVATVVAIMIPPSRPSQALGFLLLIAFIHTSLNSRCISIYIFRDQIIQL